MTSAERVAVVGTGLIGTSIALAAERVGDAVRGFDTDRDALDRAVERSGLSPAATMEECVARATIVVVSTPIPAVPGVVADALRLAPDAVVTDVASVKSHIESEIRGVARAEHLRRYVGGHPMGGSERSGPEHASASVLDGIVWALDERAAAEALGRMEAFVTKLGARPVRLDAERHDRLVAMVSHLPQVASTALMGVAASEEAGEPELLLLAAGGFRDLTRLAASSPHLWSDILVANADAIGRAISLYVDRLIEFRDMVEAADAGRVERAFRAAKDARLSVAAKPQVKAGVAVLQVPVPDRPGVLAEVTAAMSHVGVNIEDLQIVHSPEGGRGTVHLTVAADAAPAADRALRDRWFEPTRLA